MKRKIHIVVILVSALFLYSALINKLPKILIVGDSISGGYTPFVKDYFKDKAIVAHNPGNAGHSGMGLQNIREWVGDEDWDIIQFNFGLWDLCYRHPDSELYGNRDKVNGKITFSIDEYKANLDSIVTIIKEISDARLIFVTTTYVPKDEGGRFKKDAKKYNRAAKEVMKKHGVLVNYIYKDSKAIHKKTGVGADDVHYTDQGNEQLSTFIIDYLNREINESYKKTQFSKSKTARRKGPAHISAIDLGSEYLANPLGIDAQSSRFKWKLVDPDEISKKGIIIHKFSP